MRKVERYKVGGVVLLFFATATVSAFAQTFNTGANVDRTGESHSSEPAPTGFRVIHEFGGIPDGAFPWGGTLIHDAEGNIYGTTSSGGQTGGSGNGSCLNGCGTVFKLNGAGAETVLYRFGRVPDGNFPISGVVRDGAGNLYGTTYWGGTDTTAGTVYKVTEAGAETVLYSFQGGTDGLQPQSTLLLDSTRSLYGTTLDTVFELAEGGQKTLHVFTGPPDGNYAMAGLIQDATGNFYGTTQTGGTTGCGGVGCGTVFKVDPQGNETILYSFTGGNDGANPLFGDLARDSEGNLYGTTSTGGLQGNCLALGCGTVFKLSPDGVLTVLHSFTGEADGDLSQSGVVFDEAGNLYGTASSGGDLSCNPPDGCGVVYKIDRSGNFSVLHHFEGTDGWNPVQGVMLYGGNLYGTTFYGGAYGYGVIYRLSSAAVRPRK